MSARLAIALALLLPLGACRRASSDAPKPPIPTFKAFWSEKLSPKVEDRALAKKLDAQVSSTTPRLERQPCRMMEKILAGEFAPGAPIRTLHGSPRAVLVDGECWLLQFYERNLTTGMRAVMRANGEVLFVWVVPEGANINPHPPVSP